MRGVIGISRGLYFLVISNDVQSDSIRDYSSFLRRSSGSRLPRVIDSTAAGSSKLRSFTGVRWYFDGVRWSHKRLNLVKVLFTPKHSITIFTKKENMGRRRKVPSIFNPRKTQCQTVDLVQVHRTCHRKKKNTVAAKRRLTNNRRHSKDAKSSTRRALGRLEIGE